MAIYTNAAAVNNKLGSALRVDLEDLNEDGATGDTVVTDDAIEEATAFIDGKISARYPTPLADIAATPATPPLIRKIATYLVAAELLLSRPGAAEQRKAYLEWAHAQLEAIRKGELNIVDADGNELAELDAEDAAVGMAYDDTEPVFAGHDDDLVDRMDRW